MAWVDAEAGRAEPTAGAGLGLGRLLARLATALEAERPHWFTWVPVFLGAGIGLYFALPFEPTLAAALAGVVAVAALWIALPRGGIPAALALGLLALASGFALAKTRTEATRAPVLEKRLGNVEVAGYVVLVEGKPKRGGRRSPSPASRGWRPRRPPRACACAPWRRSGACARAMPCGCARHCRRRPRRRCRAPTISVAPPGTSALAASATASPRPSPTRTRRRHRCRSGSARRSSACGPPSAPASRAVSRARPGLSPTP